MKNKTLKYIVVFAWPGLMSLTSCEFETPPDMPVLSAEPLPPTGTEIVVTDSSDYSDEFLESLKTFDHRHSNITLDKNRMIVDSDTFYFPAEPEIGKSLTLTGRQDNLVVGLTVERINYSTLRYKAEMVEFGKNNLIQMAQVHLSPDFYKSDAFDQVNNTGYTLPISEYRQSDNSCTTIIRLGVDDQNDNLMIARLIKNCNDKIRDIHADDFPVLYEK